MPAAENTPPRFPKRLIVVMALAAVMLLAGWFGYRHHLAGRLTEARLLLAAGHFEDADDAFNQYVKWPLAADVDAERGAVRLVRGEIEAALGHFAAALEHSPEHRRAITDSVLNALLEPGRYDHGMLYVSFLRQAHTPEQLKPHAVEIAAVALGARDVPTASAFFDQAEGYPTQTERYQRVEALLATAKQKQSLPVALDRNDRPLVVFDLETNQYKVAEPELLESWGDPNDADTLMGSLLQRTEGKTLHNTLDLNLQTAAAKAMGNYRGAIVMIAPKTGDVLAAYGTEGYQPFSTAFEPGSTVGVLTYALFLEHGGYPQILVPKKYEASRTIAGKTFYDWTAHGQINTVEEGVAVSSNLVFAQMGINVGVPEITRGFEKLFFDTKPIRYLGKIKKRPTDNWELAKLCIGLDSLEVTTYSLAMLAATIAGDGNVPNARFVERVDNIDGATLWRVDSSTMVQLFAFDGTAEKVRAAMRAAVTDKRGTARRATAEGIDAAMVTGTAGDRPFNSIMIGFFPYEKPTIAFALFLHEGGKCEINGARVAQRLQTSIRQLAPDYLEVEALPLKAK